MINLEKLKKGECVITTHFKIAYIDSCDIIGSQVQFKYNEMNYLNGELEDFRIVDIKNENKINYFKIESTNTHFGDSWFEYKDIYFVKPIVINAYVNYSKHLRVIGLEDVLAIVYPQYNYFKYTFASGRKEITDMIKVSKHIVPEFYIFNGDNTNQFNSIKKFIERTIVNKYKIEDSVIKEIILI